MHESLGLKKTKDGKFQVKGDIIPVLRKKIGDAEFKKILAAAKSEFFKNALLVFQKFLEYGYTKQDNDDHFWYEIQDKCHFLDTVAFMNKKIGDDVVLGEEPDNCCKNWLSIAFYEIQW